MTILENSIWLEHPKYPGYRFSPEGNCLSLKHGRYKLLKQRIKPNGYRGWCLSGKEVFIHRIIAQIFCEPRENKNFVNHKNGLKFDNDAKNLEWCDMFENQQHARDVLKKDFSHKRGEKSNFAKLDSFKVRQIRGFKNSGLSQREIGEKFGISQGAVWAIFARKVWAHLD